MEQGKGKGSSSSSSSSSITELFGKKESPSAGIIGTLFAPQSKVLGEHSLHPDMVAENQDYPNQPWNTKHGTTGNPSKGHEGEYQSAANREVKSINYQEEQRTQQPCHLSSSIYYGGQDVYTLPKSNQGSGLNSGYKDVGVDESGFASRGNWWQGSLYY